MRYYGRHRGKKKMSITQHTRIAYLPAQLRKTTSKGRKIWLIEFYQTDPIDGQRKRHRHTLDMNRIHNKRQRTVFARTQIERINKLLPLGYPYSDDFETLEDQINIIEALALALEDKQKNGRHQSIKSYKSQVKIFSEYLKEKDMQDLPIDIFDQDMAITYVEHVFNKGNIGPVTYNNYITLLGSLFSFLVDKKYLAINPFSGIKKMRPNQKQRRSFTVNETQVFINYIKDKDQTLLLCILLQFYCFIRPKAELRRLRFKHFDLVRGVIIIDGQTSKNKNASIVTIPDLMIDFLIDFGFNDYHPSWIVFGRGNKPHPDKAIGHNTLYERHKKYLYQLNELNKKHPDVYPEFRSIQGLSLYSWKDTGAIAMVQTEKDNIVDVKNQMRHESLEYTQKYLTQLNGVNDKIKKRKVNLLDI